ncbi:MAG: DUF4286 family protein [Ferruginibacter sp.]
MILYNVTVKVSTAITDEWLHWLKEEHIGEVLATGCFDTADVFRLLDIDDTEGPTYAIQYRTDQIERYHTYIECHAPVMRQKGFDKWGDQFIAFRSVMEAVN